MRAEHRDLLLAGWTVLATAALTAADGELGRVWHGPRPVVYRALGRPEELGLVVPVGEEPGHGPRRQVVTVAGTGTGAADVERWLQRRVDHIREVRSPLQMKLALLDRRSGDPGPQLDRQRALLEPIMAALTAQAPRVDDATLAARRRTTTRAALAILDEVSRGL